MGRCHRALCHARCRRVVDQRASDPALAAWCLMTRSRSSLAGGGATDPGPHSHGRCTRPWCRRPTASSSPPLTVLVVRAARSPGGRSPGSTADCSRRPASPEVILGSVRMTGPIFILADRRLRCMMIAPEADRVADPPVALGSDRSRWWPSPSFATLYQFHWALSHSPVAGRSTSHVRFDAGS